MTRDEIERELAVIHEQINALYWTYTRTRRGAPPCVVAPELHQRQSELRELHRHLRHTGRSEAPMMKHQEHAGAYRFAEEGSASLALLVGEDNPQSVDPRHALYPYPPGCAGQRLSDILGIGMSGQLSMWRTNLCSPRWSARAARERAIELLDGDHPWSVIVMLGRKVTDAFARVIAPGDAINPWDVNHVMARLVPGEVLPKLLPRPVTIVSLPHPSGRNRIWNDANRWIDARKILRAAAPYVQWGDLDEVAA